MSQKHKLPRVHLWLIPCNKVMWEEGGGNRRTFKHFNAKNKTNTKLK